MIRLGGSGLEVLVDGRVHSLSIEAVGPATFVLRQGDRVQTFHCAQEGDVIYLFWEGATYRLEREDEGSRGGHRHVSGALEAPMPGKVIQVKAAPGDAVHKGQEILVIEAMKMENAVRAPRDGVVKSVAVTVGQMVSPGVVLVELE